jgi:nicotinamide-nucleotide adenylyltransferase
MTGRFQPFHNGHLALAKQILQECDELVIVIGSAQFNFIDKDPFTAGERVLMIHARWIAYLRSMAPPFGVLYSGNDFVKHLALSQDSRLAVKSPKFAKKDEYNGTNIRRLMLAGGQWKRLVPPAVAKVIEQANGIERMRVLAGSDSNPQRW